jgi:acyl-CoA thioester hydrolase
VSRDAFLPRSAYPASCPIQTRWHDNDIYGHVNNVVYYSWFDTAVNAALVERGLLDINHGRCIGLVVETGCRYARPLAFPEIVTAAIGVETLSRSSVRYRIGIFTGSHEEAAAEGFFIHVYVDRETRRPQPLDDAMRAGLGALMLR